MRAWAVMVSVIALLVAGCSDTSGDEGTSPPDGTTTSESTSEPAPESTGAESTQPREKKPSVEIATLPIGPGAQANQPDDQAKQCVGVSLTGLELPQGSTATYRAPTLKQDGTYFEIDQSACGGQSPVCSGHQISADETPACFAGVRQVTNAEGHHATLIITADATCATAEDCKALEPGGISQIGFDSRALGGPGPSESPIETPETPETPAETPSDG
ncbi:hypothetical protein EV649_0967 [Kribbella sp. VKM Ac-2569]|uniref:hypothetical protein n=1 Tax=Kribbella sp. VKM Ac-2569 TaxID=2512220 RepID=UPI00102B412F|nr:hypothetical protein [Kribbella sp. VKM Ac-2569]RZT27213.1 hypothetical protein EV649_0967 [Kribbella sp. VKM Ac-2569]